MSGGSHSYRYREIEQEAYELSKSNLTYRKAFAHHLELVAKAMHAIEWVDSGDCGPGDDKEAVLSCINPSLVFTTLIEEAVRIRDELSYMLKRERK